MAQPFVVARGQLAPSPSDVVTVAGEVVDLTGCAIAFSMRPIGASTLTVNAASAVVVGDPTDGTWRYDWASGDTAIAGTYSAWITVTLASGKAEDTPEFEIEISAHATAGTYALVSLEELIDHLRFGNQIRKVTENDEQTLRRLILAASNRCAEYTTHRFAVEAATAKIFRYDGETVLNLAPWDLRNLTSIQMDTDGSAFALDPAMYRLEPRNTPHGIYTHADLEPYTPMANNALNFWGGGGSIGIGTAAFGRQVTITGDWGWTTIPESIKHGVMVLAAREFMNPLGAQIVRSAQVEYQFTRGGGGFGGAGGVGDSLPDEVASAWRPFVRAGF